MATDMSSSPMTEHSFRHFAASPSASPTKTENELPIEVDQSFNSSMSLSMCGSPSSPLPIKNAMFLAPSPSCSFMPRRPDPVPIQSFGPYFGDAAESSVSTKRDLGSVRVFGRELSTNAARPFGTTAAKPNGKGKMLPPKGTTPISSKQRAGIPMQWTSSNEGNFIPRLSFQAPGMSRTESEPIPGPSPKVAPSNGMDIDSPRAPFPPSPSGFSGASSFGSPGLGSFFCDSPAPPALPPAKRRSLVGSSPASPSSSPSAKRSALGLGGKPNLPVIDRSTSSSAMLFGSTRINASGARRPQIFNRRPVLAPVASTEHEDYPAESLSANAVLTSKGVAAAGTFPRAALAPMRRAFSVCDQPPMEISDDESDFEGSPSMMGLQAQKARRQARLAKVDGSPGFKKPMRSSIAVTSIAGTVEQIEGDCMNAKGIKQILHGPGGLPGFGDNEMDGKILPCHKVKEDGLVRITSGTLDDLISGKYSSKIKRYHIIDCRFDYEFNGGHIDGAVNVRSTEAVDRLLLSSNEGVHANGDTLPFPSRSGELEEGEQVVLVFHCEFSAKRAPTFAKHLRSKDRMINNLHYPKIFYPEVYILEGGYRGFFQTCPTRCEPQAYVPMDDPRHLERRNSDLHDFRKFARTSSFTYGETQSSHPTSRALPCPPLAFAAANAAAARRGAPPTEGNTITEEDSEDTSPCAFNVAKKSGIARRPAGQVGSGGTLGTNTSGNDNSPCPPSGGGLQPLFGTVKARTLGRAGFSRTASEAVVTMRR